MVYDGVLWGQACTMSSDLNRFTWYMLSDECGAQWKSWKPQLSTTLPFFWYLSRCSIAADMWTSVNSVPADHKLVNHHPINVVIALV